MSNIYNAGQLATIIKRMAQNLAETRAWQMWTDGLNDFIRANTKKNKNSRAREKVVW